MTKIGKAEFMRAVDYLAADQAAAPDTETNGDFLERHGLDPEHTSFALEAVATVSILGCVEAGTPDNIIPELVGGGFELGFVLGRQSAGAEPFVTVEDGAAA